MKMTKKHKDALKQCIQTGNDGKPVLVVDLTVSDTVCGRLTLEEEGLIAHCLKKAALAVRPSLDQLALLATFGFRGES